MPDEKIPEPTGAPEAPSTSVAPPLRDAETNRQMGEGATPQASPRPSDAHQPAPNTGERNPSERMADVGDAHAPVRADNVAEGGDKTVYDRLADKDVTPTGESGSI